MSCIYKKVREEATLTTDDRRLTTDERRPTTMDNHDGRRSKGASAAGFEVQALQVLKKITCIYTLFGEGRGRHVILSFNIIAIGRSIGNGASECVNAFQESQHNENSQARSEQGSIPILNQSIRPPKNIQGLPVIRCVTLAFEITGR